MPMVKAIIHFRYRKKKVHRFTNNLHGLQKYCSIKCFTFWENIKTTLILVRENSGFILNTCHDTAKCTETRVGFPVIFSDSDDRLSLNLHRFVILYISCDTQSVGLGQYCLPKVSNGFKERLKSTHATFLLQKKKEPMANPTYIIGWGWQRAVVVLKDGNMLLYRCRNDWHGWFVSGKTD